MILLKATRPGFEAVLNDDMTWVRQFGPKKDLADLTEAMTFTDSPFGYMPLWVGLNRLAEQIQSVADFDVEMVYAPKQDEDPDEAPGRVY